jgi:hypothetical protein
MLVISVAWLAVSGCGTVPAGEQGVWCRDAGAGELRILFLDGVDRYSSMGRDAAGTVTVLVDQQPYEIVVEDGVTYWHTWIGADEYANELTLLTPGEELILDGSLVYAFVGDHDLAYDVESMESCEGGS